MYVGSNNKLFLNSKFYLGGRCWVLRSTKYVLDGRGVIEGDTGSCFRRDEAKLCRSFMAFWWWWLLLKKGQMGLDILHTTTLNMKEHFKVGLHAISKIGVTEQADLIKPVFSCQHWTGNESYFLWQGELVDDRFRVQNMKLQFRILNLNFGFQFSRGRLLTWLFGSVESFIS